MASSDSSKTYDLLVIGAGILGIFHAYHALKRGFTVALIEQNKMPRSASTRNFGQIVPSGMNSQWQAYGRRSLEIYKELQSATDISLRPQGSIYVASDQEELGLLEELSVRNKEQEYPSQLLTRQSCLQGWPALQPNYCKGGLFFRQEVSLDARVAAHRIIGLMEEQMGLDFFPARTVIEADSGGRLVALRAADGSRFSGMQAVVCNGSDFQKLFPDIFRQSDLQVTKLHMLRTAPQPSQRIRSNILTGRSIRRYESFRECPSYTAVKAKEPTDSYAMRYGIHILLTQNEDGSVVLGDSHEYADAKNQDELGYEIDNRINRFMMEEAMQIFKLQSWKIDSAWYGIYSQCKDQDIFRHSVDERMHIVTGIGGKGMTASPGFAEAQIEQLLNCAHTH